jgi:HEAT repeat protein
LFRSPGRTLLTLAFVLLFAAPLSADERAGATAAAEKAARDALARFEKADGDWKVRMEALVSLARIGPAAAPVLVEALRAGRPTTREFAAQALVLFADSSTQPALERALADPKSGVRIYAIQALSMLGPLPRTERNERILRDDPTVFGVQPMMAAALEREDRRDLTAWRKALADYDLRKMDSAHVGEMAPDFTLTDFTGKTYRLSQFRGDKTVVLRFILYDY